MVDLVPTQTTADPELGSSQDTIYPDGFVESLNQAPVFAAPDTEKPVQSLRQRNMDALTYALPNFMLGAFSEIAASMPGIDDADVESFLESTTPNGIYQNFVEHREGSKTAGALATSLIPIFGVTKLMKSEKVFNAATKIIGEKTARGLLASRVSMMDRVAKVKEEATLLASKQQLSFSALAEPALASRMKKEVLHEVFDSLKIGIATDAGIYTLLNESDFFFPDELSAIETAAFYGVPNLVFAGVTGSFMRYKLKNVLRDVGPLAAKERNAAGLPFADLISRPGQRDIMAMTHSYQMNIKATEFSKVTDDPTLAKNINSQMHEHKRIVGEQIHLTAQDSVLPGITKETKLTDSEFNTVLSAQKAEATTLGDVVSIEKADVAEQSLKSISNQKKSTGRELKKIKKELDAEFSGTAKHKELSIQHEDLLKKRQRLRNLNVVKLNRDGSLTLASASKETYDDLLTGKVRKTTEANLKQSLSKTAVGDILEIDDKILKTKSYAVKYNTPRGTKLVTTNDRLQIIFPETTIATPKMQQIRNPVLQGGIIDETKTLEQLPKVQAGYTRLFRAESPTVKFEDVFNVDKMKAFSPGDLKGKFFSSEIAAADYYRATYGKDAKLFYLDLPSQSLNKRKTVAGEYVIDTEKAFFDLHNTDAFQNLSFKGKTATQVSMRHAVDEFKFAEETVNKFKPTSDMPHVELDGMLELADKHGRDNPSLSSVFDFDPNGIKSFDEIEFASLTSKYREWVTQRDAMGMVNTGRLKLPKDQIPTREDLIISLNLPNDGVTGSHPLVQMFDDLYMNQVDELAEVFPSLEAFKNSVHKKVVPHGDINGKFIQPSEIKLRGSQLKTFDEPRKPVVLITENSFVDPLRREELISEAMRLRTELITGLKNAHVEGAPLISLLTEESLRDVDRWAVAKAVDSLVDGSQLHGDKFAQSMFGVSNQPAIQAVDAIRGAQDNIWRSYAASRFEPHNKTFSRLLSNDHKGDLNSFALLTNQQGLGWRATSQFEPVEEAGKLIGYKIPLEEHATNKAMFNKLYPEQEIDEIMYMPNPLIKQGDAYEPMVVSPLAAESAMAFNEISQDVLTLINYLRKMSGKAPIPRKPFHMPPKNLRGKELIYLINKNTGELQTIKAGNTATQVRNLADEEIAAAKKQGTDLFIATETEIENYRMVGVEAFESMTDYSTSFVQTGKAKGTSFGQVIEIGPEIVTRMQETLINQYNTVSKVTSAMLFEPQIQQALFAARTAVIPSTKTTKLKPTATSGNTIQDVYINRLLGKKSGSKNKAIGKAYGAVEDIYDSLLQKAWDEKVAFFKGGQTAAQAQSGFAALDKATSGFQPFKDSVEFMENTMRIKPPHTMLKHASKLNNLVGLTMLRMFEIGLGLINIGTLPTLIPPVAKALARQPGESLVDWKKANAAWSSAITDDAVIWNPTRAFTSGMHYMFSTDKAISAQRKQMLKRAGEKGHLWQKTVEQLQLFTAPAEGYHEKMIKHYAELSSMFVDKTEELSRSISYATFYNMGTKNLKLGDEAAMDFAHHMANRVIGDFRPNNRPQIFQGATGMPFGLFTTFAWNYLQRVFGYLEKGQFKTFATQMGLQASFFGAKSLPGFNQYVEHFTSNYDGTENLVDRMQANLGSDFTDAFLYGGVGSLTGLAMHTRTDIVLPGSNFKYADSVLDFAAATSFVKQTFGGLGEIANSLKTNRGFNGQQLTEIMSRASPIRATRGWFNMAAGQATDVRGQVINNNTRSAVEIFSNLTSIRSHRNQKVVEEFARQRSQQLKQQQIRGEMRKAMRSAFRSGKLDADFIDNMAKGYLDSGGEPAGFSGFLKDQMFDGLIDKSYLRAIELSTQRSKQKDYMRLIDIIAEDNN